MKTLALLLAIGFAANVSLAQPIQTPCAGGTLLASNAYSFCESDHLWHIVVDGWYRCPGQMLPQSFRTFDTNTMQSCEQPALAIAGVGSFPQFQAINGINSRPVNYIGYITLCVCKNGYWEEDIYKIYTCPGDPTVWIDPNTLYPVPTGVACDSQPPQPALPLAMVPQVLPSGQFQVTTLGPPALAMEVEVSSNLTDWASLVSVANFTGSYSAIDTNGARLSPRFYRSNQSYESLYEVYYESLYLAPTFTATIGNPLSSCGCASPENPNSTATPGSRQDNALGNVFLQTGELVQDAVDLSIPGRGFDWRFERQYRSGMEYNGPLGQGWDFNYNRRLVVQTNGNVMRMDGGWRADIYVLTTNSTGPYYEPPSGFYTSLTTNQDGYFVERDRHGIVTSYLAPDYAGVARLHQITDRNNNSMLFQYNPAGQLTNVLDTLNRSIAYA